MPIYEYNCSKCGHQFEVLIRNNSDYPARCPKCNAPKPAKMFSAFAVSTSGPGADADCAGCPGADSGCGHACNGPKACPYS